MDRSRGHRRDSGGGDLGIDCFGHKQSDFAFAGADNGRRYPVTAVPWQGRFQCSCFVYRGAGALFCRDRRGALEFLAATEIPGQSRQGDKGEPNSSAAGCSTPLAADGCASSGIGFCAATVKHADPGCTSGTVIVGGANGSALCIAKPILVAR